MPETKKLRTVVLDIGKQRKRDIARLLAGEGPLVARAAKAASDAAGGDAPVQPIVILYERRSRKRRSLLAALLGGR